jgi:hypothetical protein
MSDFYGQYGDMLTGWLSNLDDVSLMLSLVEPYAKGLRLGKPVAPIVRFDMALVSDLIVVVDATLGQHGEPGALWAGDSGTLLAELPRDNLFGHPHGHLITVVVLCALLLTMPWWSEGLSPGARSVLNDEIGLLALAAALVQMIFGEGR